MRIYFKLIVSLIILLSINILVLNSSYFNQMSILESETVQSYIDNSLSKNDVSIENKKELRSKLISFYESGLREEVIKANNLKEQILFFNIFAIIGTLIVFGFHLIYSKFKDKQIVLVQRFVLMLTLVWLLLVFSHNSQIISYSRDLKEFILLGVIPFIVINFTLWILKKYKEESFNISKD